MKKLIQEFKDFAVKGNMIDMAVGIIIGTAFNNVVNTLVNQVVMPPLSMITGNSNLIEKKIILKEAVGESQEIAIGYGQFLEVLIDFVIIALTVFIIIIAVVIVLTTMVSGLYPAWRAGRVTPVEAIKLV